MGWRGDGGARPMYAQADLFATLREQFVDNWDTWSLLSAFTGSPVTPTLTIQDDSTRPTGTKGSAFVRQRLTNAQFQITDLEDFTTPLGSNPPNRIPAGNLAVDAPVLPATTRGTFDGKVTVTLNAHAPAAGVYRGMLLVQEAAAPRFEPLAWIVVMAT